MKKAIAFTLTLVMLLCCLAGCGEQPAVEEPSDTVMTVNGVDVSWDEYMFWIGYASMYLNYQYSMYGMSIDWSDDTTGNVAWCVDYAKQTVTQKAIIISKCKELGLELDENDQAEIESAIADYKTQCCGADATDEQFEAYLKSNQFSNIAVLRASQEATAYTNKLFDKLYGENGSTVGDEKLLIEAANAGYTHCNHILLLTQTTEGEALSEEESAAKKAELEGYMAEMNAIEDPEARYARFLELKEEHCEDNGTEAYQFGEGIMVEEFYNMSLDLEPYEMGIVESTYGYHLIIGLPLDLDGNVTDSSGNPISLRDTMLNAKFTEELQGWEKDAEIVMAPDFEEFDFAKEVFGTNGFIYQCWADRSAPKAEK